MNIVDCPIEDVIPYARNPRKNTAAIAAVVASIREFGFRQPIVVAPDMTVVVGHTRLEAARALGLATVPVHVAEGLTEAQAKAYRLADNRTGENAEWDDDLLALEIADLDGDIDLSLTGFTEEELAALGAINLGGGLTDPDTMPDAPEHPITALGDVWSLGVHRLMCGDSTIAESVALLMQGRLCELVVTDPPYGVSYADKNRHLNAVAPANRIQVPIENDHLDKEGTQALWKSAFAQMSAVMQRGAVVYCFMPQGGDQMMLMMMMMMGAGIEPRHELIWVKNNHVLGRVDYAYKHEPILYAWKDAGHKFHGDFQTSLLEFHKPQKSDLHPTMKPVPLIVRLIENSSVKGGLLYEPFSGSGTTIIAAEETGRECYAMELSPSYVDVAVTRWQNFTGQEAVLEGDGRTFNVIAEARAAA